MTRTITITSGKGGVGKTNLSVNLALCLAMQGRTTCLFDADLGLANVNLLLGIYPQKSLEDVISGQCSLADITVKTEAGIDIIPGSSGVEALADLDDARRDRLAKSLGALEKYDFVIFDTSAGISRNVISFCLSCPEIILVIVPEVTSLTDAYALLKILVLKGFSATVHVAVNRCRSLPMGRQVFAKFHEAIKRHLRFEVSLLGTIPHDSCVEETVAAQEPFVRRHPDCPASLQVMSIARHLIKNPLKDPHPSSVQSFWQTWMHHRAGPLQIAVPTKVKKHRTSAVTEKAPCAKTIQPDTSGSSAGLPETARDSLTPPEPHLPVLPSAALACIETCRSTADPRRISQLIRLDAAMTANILGLAAGTGALADPVDSVQQVVSSMGAKSVETLALSCAHFACFENPPTGKIPNIARFWQHSLRCALLAELLAERAGQIDPRGAYLAGLLHDIGKLAPTSPCGGNPKGPSVKPATVDKSPPHAAAGAKMLAAWGLSPLLIDAVRYHHAPADEIRHAFSLVKIVFVANGLASSTEGAGQKGLQHAYQLLKIKPQSVQEMIGQSESGVQKAAAILGIGLEKITAGDPVRPTEKDPGEINLFQMLRSQAQLGGWLQSLMEIEGAAAAVDKICATIQLLFKVSAPLFFIHDTQNDRLVCHNPPTGMRLNIDLQTDRGLLVTCFRHGTMVSAFDEPGEIMDLQIGHLLGCEGIVCLPVVRGTACRAVIVIAADANKASHLKAEQPMLSLLARQAACALSANGPL